MNEQAVCEVESAHGQDDRRLGIGGSDIAAILGLSPWKTPVAVYLEKRGELHRTPDNLQALYWGTILEDIVAKEFSDRTGKRIQRVNKTIVHPEHEWMRANIDRAVVNPSISGNVRWREDRLTTDQLLECKTANGFAAAQWGDPGTDQIPDYYIPQPHWYMAITGTIVCHVAVLIGGSDYRIYTVRRDDELIEMMIAAAAKFWQRVVEGNAPNPSSTDDAKLLWARHTKAKRVIVDHDIAEACKRINYLKERLEEIKAEENTLKLNVMLAMRDAEEAEYMGAKVATWKNNKPSTVVAWESALPHLQALPEAARIIEQFSSQKPGPRVLRIAKTKE